MAVPPRPGFATSQGFLPGLHAIEGYGAGGFRFGDIAYTPDVNAIPDAAAEQLEGLDVWIIDALRYTPHPSHFSVSDALGWIERMKPRRAVLTNLHNDLDYATIAAEAPEGVDIAFDGMVIEAA